MADLLDRLYMEFLGRPADESIRRLTAAQGWAQNEDRIRAHLAESDEFRRRQIMQLYTQVLGRDADPGGLDTHVAAMRQGKGLEGVRRALATSPEFMQSPRVVMTDPAYAAWMRQMQFDESEIQSGLAAAKEQARRRIAGQEPAWAMQRQDIAERHDRDFEARGMLRAGGRLRRIHEDQARVDFQATQAADAAREGIVAQETAAARRLADLRRRNAEEVLAARDRLTLRHAGLS